MKRTAYIFLLVIVALSCRKKKDPACPPFSGGVAPPSGFYFIVKQNNTRLLDSILDNLKLSYYVAGVKNYVSDFGRAGADGYTLGAMASWQIGLRSADSNIKDYYLEFPNGDVDTLYVDYKHYNACEADTSACHCIYPCAGAKYNGQWAGYDPAVTTQQVYVFIKP